MSERTYTQHYVELREQHEDERGAQAFTAEQERSEGRSGFKPPSAGRLAAGARLLARHPNASARRLPRLPNQPRHRWSGLDDTATVAYDCPDEVAAPVDETPGCVAVCDVCFRLLDDCPGCLSSTEEYFDAVRPT